MAGLGEAISKKLTMTWKVQYSPCSTIGSKIPKAVSHFYILIENTLTLCSAIDTEAIEFQRIRIACLPEVILAYITVLDFSSRFLSRDLLLKGMDLASVIAAEDSDVGTCFVSAGRMAELVECFACLSKTMIQADDLGMKSSISKRKKDGKTLGLWSIRASFPLGANGRMS